MIFSHEASIPLWMSAIHLDDWLFNLSKADYNACAKGHRAIGTNRGSQFAGMENVESMAGALLIQYYRTELLQPDHVRLFSAASRGYLMHLVPFQLEVGWEMQVFSISTDQSMLRCTIDVQNPLWIQFIGVFNATNFWICRHLIEETQGFARDLALKESVRYEKVSVSVSLR